MIVAAILQATLVLFVAPLAIGVMRLVRARLEGREGAPLRQPLRDLRKLFGKERIAPEHSSAVFALAPLVVASTALVAGALTPLVSTRTALSSSGDILVVVSLLLLGTVALALAGLDPGTAFGGMGSSREVTIAALAEPTILLAAFALSTPAHSSNLARIVAVRHADPGALLTPVSLLALVAFAVVTLAETGRVPVDNPSTHLELTMVHEAMVLEYAGPDLALVELGAWVRLVVFLGLAGALFFPWGIATGSGVAALALASVVFLAKILLLAAAVSVSEVFMAKLRLFRVPELLAFSFVFAMLAVTAAVFFG